MFGLFNITTDSIVKPLLTLVVKLEKHIEKQARKAAKHEQKILDTIARRDAALADADKAKAVAENVKKIIG